MSATVDGRHVQVGGPTLLHQHGVAELPVVEQWRGEGAIILHVLVDGQVAGALKLADEIREESRAAVRALHDRNVEVVMITGDAEAVAASVAAELGIDRYFAGVRPEDKSAKVQQLQAEGRRVAMVGDGVNDAPALAQADVGIAIGAGTDVAIASAGVILASDDPRSVLSVIELSTASYRKMKQNLWWAAGYNLISVPLAAGVLAPIGFVLPMSVGAILMSLSTIVVAANAQLLRRLDLRPDTIVPTSSPTTDRATPYSRRRAPMSTPRTENRRNDRGEARSTMTTDHTDLADRAGERRRSTTATSATRAATWPGSSGSRARPAASTAWSRKSSTASTSSPRSPPSPPPWKVSPSACSTTTSNTASPTPPGSAAPKVTPRSRKPPKRSPASSGPDSGRS